ncbi:hypothetical protein BDR06DRAFT_1042010 [Suillus hirtellus]|nr:hypothetical protein BDR06DRAFT_1042010 [Suillus hirtellus]
MPWCGKYPTSPPFPPAILDAQSHGGDDLCKHVQKPVDVTSPIPGIPGCYQSSTSFWYFIPFLLLSMFELGLVDKHKLSRVRGSAMLHPICQPWQFWCVRKPDFLVDKILVVGGGPSSDDIAAEMCTVSLVVIHAVTLTGTEKNNPEISSREVGLSNSRLMDK